MNVSPIVAPDAQVWLTRLRVTPERMSKLKTVPQLETRPENPALTPPGSLEVELL